MEFDYLIIFFFHFRSGKTSDAAFRWFVRDTTCKLLFSLITLSCGLLYSSRNYFIPQTDMTTNMGIIASFRVCAKIINRLSIFTVFRTYYTFIIIIIIYHHRVSFLALTFIVSEQHQQNLFSFFDFFVGSMPSQSSQSSQFPERNN